MVLQASVFTGIAGIRAGCARWIGRLAALLSLRRAIILYMSGALAQIDKGISQRGYAFVEIVDNNQSQPGIKISVKVV